jgi:hypothetical protein
MKGGETMSKAETIMLLLTEMLVIIALLELADKNSKK